MLTANIRKSFQPESASWLQDLLDRNQLDPLTNTGMYNLREFRRDLIEQFQGCGIEPDEVIIFHRVGDWSFVFGSNASIVRQFATHIRSVGNGSQRSHGWEAIRNVDVAEVTYALEERGYSVRAGWRP